jgi:sulfur-oxidizing protein SoxY
MRKDGNRRISRRALLGGAMSAGVVAAGPVVAPGRARAQAPAPAQGPGSPVNLGPEEPVDITMKRLFGTRPIKPAGDAVKLELPLIAENGAVVPVAVEVTTPMTPAAYVKSVYIVSDKNRRPMNAKFNLTPAMGQAYVATNLRLGESTDVRAIVEMSDGTLLMARREVKVTVGGCGG